MFTKISQIKHPLYDILRGHRLQCGNIEDSMLKTSSQALQAGTLA